MSSMDVQSIVGLHQVQQPWESLATCARLEESNFSGVALSTLARWAKAPSLPPSYARMLAEVGAVVEQGRHLPECAAKTEHCSTSSGVCSIPFWRSQWQRG